MIERSIQGLSALLAELIALQSWSGRDTTGGIVRQRRHALSGALYDVRDDGNVDVTSRDDVTGTFTPDGEWISGELHHADPHLCGWLAGPQLPPRLAVLPRFRSTEAPPKSNDMEDSR